MRGYIKGIEAMSAEERMVVIEKGYENGIGAMSTEERMAAYRNGIRAMSAEERMEASKGIREWDRGYVGHGEDGGV